MVLKARHLATYIGGWLCLLYVHIGVSLSCRHWDIWLPLSLVLVVEDNLSRHFMCMQVYVGNMADFQIERGFHPGHNVTVVSGNSILVLRSLVPCS